LEHKPTCPDCGQKWLCTKTRCSHDRLCSECTEREYRALEKRLRSSSNSFKAKLEKHFEGRPAPKGPAIASTIFLLLALLEIWPYSFYTLLRLVVCGSAIYLALHAAKMKKTRWLWLMGGTALLFNPLIPVPIARSSWQVLDLIAAVIFVVSLRTLSNVLSRKREEGTKRKWIFWSAASVTVTWFSIHTVSAWTEPMGGIWLLNQYMPVVGIILLILGMMYFTPGDFEMNRWADLEGDLLWNCASFCFTMNVIALSDEVVAISNDSVFIFFPGYLVVLGLGVAGIYNTYLRLTGRVEDYTWLDE